MVAGHLQVKKGYFYIVLSYKDMEGERQTKWLPTHLKDIKGNKKKAEEKLLMARMEFNAFDQAGEENYIHKMERAIHLLSDIGFDSPLNGLTIQQKAEILTKCIQNIVDILGLNAIDMKSILLTCAGNTEEEDVSDPADILYGDFLQQWLEEKKPNIELTTYAAYESNVNTIIAPYFDKRNITLKMLNEELLNNFYKEQLKRVKESTVRHYKAVIHNSLEYAFKELKIIPCNYAELAMKIKVVDYIADYYKVEEALHLLEIIKDTKLEIPVFLGLFYGFRRSEIVGLSWSAIDFTRATFTIRQTVTSAFLNRKTTIISKKTGQSRSSIRSYPLIPVFKQRLLEIKSKQEEFRQLCGNCYCQEYLDYVCVDELGYRVRPNYITETWPKFLKENNMRVIRFHDLRHSCASLLLYFGLSMKEIQEWLGHSEFSTTAKFYAHLDVSAKYRVARKMEQGLGLLSTKKIKSYRFNRKLSIA